MIDFNEDKNRHTVPRWRSIGSSIDMGELASIMSAKKVSGQSKLIDQGKAFLESEFLKLKNAWDSSNDIYDAENLLSVAIVCGKESESSILTAAQVIFSNAKLPSTIRDFAGRILDSNHSADKRDLPIDEAKIRLEIAQRKKFLLLNPRDGLRLTEMALLHANLGQIKTSRQLLNRALLLHQNDRYVLRSASRFFVHINEPDVALYWLRKSARTTKDPWLLSAQLAVEGVANEDLTVWRQAKRLLSNQDFSSRELSELASEIGTAESHSGSRRNAGKFFRQSAEDPTENAIAQIEWISRKANLPSSGEFISKINISHEALANNAYSQSQWRNGLEACDSWQMIEPFSTSPAVFGSFLAAILPDALSLNGIDLAKRGLIANPGNIYLNNNLAVLYAYRNELDSARKFHSIAKALGRESENKIINRATQGLIEFREGNIDLGLKSYIWAIEQAAEKISGIVALRALCFLGRETARFDIEATKFVLTKIEDAISKFKKKNLKIPKDIESLFKEVEQAVSGTMLFENGPIKDIHEVEFELEF